MTLPVTFRFSRADGSVGERTGYPTLTPGLVVSCDQDQRSAWVVTHYRSGAYLGFAFDSPEGALAYANALGDLADWTISGFAIRAMPEVCDAAEAMGREMGGIAVSSDVPVAWMLDNGVPA